MADERTIRLRARDRNLPRVIARGQKAAPHEDLYHWILTRTWPQFFLVIAGAFLVLNSLFATLYLSFPGAISNLPPGSFEDAFYFSVQTLATIGYGVMAPASRVGHVLVVIEATTGLLCIAVMTGITFAKFARPTARVLFASRLAVTPRNGEPHLVLRLANWRRNQMIDAQIKILLLITERTTEGEVLRRPQELPLVRDRTQLFMLTWLVMHKIDETSPFHGKDAIEKLRAKQAEIFVSVTGYDETIGNTVHARAYYTLDDIAFGARYKDVLVTREDGTREIDYRHFHEVIPIESRKNPAS